MNQQRIKQIIRESINEEVPQGMALVPWDPEAGKKAAPSLWKKTIGWLSKGGNNLLGKMGNMGKFGKYGAAAALAGAGLYGAHKLYDYWQEPDKTGGYPEPSMPQTNPYGYGYGYPYMMPQTNPYGYGYGYDPYMMQQPQMPQMNMNMFGYNPNMAQQSQMNSYGYSPYMMQ